VTGRRRPVIPVRMVMRWPVSGRDVRAGPAV